MRDRALPRPVLSQSLLCNLSHVGVILHRNEAKDRWAVVLVGKRAWVGNRFACRQRILMPTDFSSAGEEEARAVKKENLRLITHATFGAGMDAVSTNTAIDTQKQDAVPSDSDEDGDVSSAGGGEGESEQGDVDASESDDSNSEEEEEEEEDEEEEEEEDE